jgi:threonine/homoserine/homoserine lactone efflux protein
MRSALPFILVLLAIFTAACIAYIAWELSSGKSGDSSSSAEKDKADDVS